MTRLTWFLIWFAASLIAGLIGLSLTSPARAQAVCMAYSEFKSILAKQHHEEPIGGGFVNDHVSVQVFASPDGATFTVLGVNTSGLACIIAAGKGWEPGKLPVGGSPS